MELLKQWKKLAGESNHAPAAALATIASAPMRMAPSSSAFKIALVSDQSQAGDPLHELVDPHLHHFSPARTVEPQHAHLSSCISSAAS
jgi:hypothetical protein